MKLGVVVFDFDEWKSLYPQFAQLTQAQAQNLFDQATFYFNNSPQSLEPDVGRRKVLLYLLTAHIAQLAQSVGAGGLVGQITAASRGSVSVSAAQIPTTAGMAWFTQTQYGISFWQMTAQYRQMRMLPGRPHPARIFP